MRWKFQNKAQRSSWVLSSIFLVVLLLVGVLCFQYYLKLQSTLKTESYEYLQEISKQIAGNVSRSINDNFLVLDTIAAMLRSSGMENFDNVKPEIINQQNIWNYKDILLIDGYGNAYDVQGKNVVLDSAEYLTEAVVNRNRAMSPSQVINGTECIIFITPVEKLVMNGMRIHALAATYALSTFDTILSMNAFSGRAYAYLVQKNGAVVVRSSSNLAPQTGYNILSTLAKAKLEEGGNISQVKSDLVIGKSGVISYTLNATRTYMAYAPLDNKEWYLLTFVPGDVVNTKSDLLMELTLLLSAAITLAFALLGAYQMYSYSLHKRKLEQIAYIDPLTGGHTIERFYEIAAALLGGSNKPPYALIYVNVEKFKLLNEEYGRRACDELLYCLHKGISSDLGQQECIGRLFADNYCVLVTYSTQEELIMRFETWYESTQKSHMEQGGVWLAPVVEFGVFIILNDSMSFHHMIDRAKLALKESSLKLRGKLRYAVYNDEIRRHLFREKHLENMMEASLNSREFQVYLQPKYYTDAETIGGAEALVRWKSQEGMIFPDEFIGLFEKNGFIVQLDLWVFEEVCRSIRIWLDTAKTPVKISVNCSRVQLRNPRFLDRYTEICQRHHVPAKYIELELTENVVFENVATLSGIIDNIHAAGFGCSMDDFGSGYSSLNLIGDIPVDTIKLDKVFFRNGSKDLARTQSVVGSILTMSRSLNLTTVAEGVEERCQVDMLKFLGCDFIQGYYFAKPMPIPAFELLAFGPSPDDSPKIAPSLT